RTNRASDQSGRNGKSRTAAAMIGQPTPTCRKWLTGWAWSSWYFATSRSKRDPAAGSWLGSVGDSGLLIGGNLFRVLIHFSSLAPGVRATLGVMPWCAFGSL